MSSGRIGSASGLNIFIDWTSSENSINANLYLYNQYRISTSKSKNYTISIDGNIKNGTINLGEKSAGSTTLIGTHTITGFPSNSNIEVAANLDINLTSYNGVAVNRLECNGIAKTDSPGVVAPTINSLIIQSKTINSITCAFSTNGADTFYYKLSNKTSWIKGSNNITDGAFTIYDLDPNTDYTINFIARNWVNENNDIYVQNVRDVSTKTYDIARITELSNFEHGSNATVKITNPAGISSLNLVMKVGDTQILSRTVSTGANIITFSDVELDNLYRKYGTGSSVTATFILSGGGYTNQKTCTVNLKGNQNTMRTNVSGSWKRAKLWTNVNGDWKRSVLWTNVNGTWKRVI